MDSMTTTTTDTTECPAWCTREHLRDDRHPDYFHDSTRWLLKPAGHAASSEDPVLSVHVAQYVPQDGEPWAPVVELGPEGRESWRLTADEADELAVALLAAARRVTPLPVQPDSLEVLTDRELARAAVTITHPVWCRNYPEDDGRLKGECDGEHRGDDFRLDAGPTAAFQVSATAVEGFEVLKGGEVLSHGVQVQVTVWDRESGAGPASAYLDAAEVERLRQLLELAVREASLLGRR